MSDLPALTVTADVTAITTRQRTLLAEALRFYADAADDHDPLVPGYTDAAELAADAGTLADAFDPTPLTPPEEEPPPPGLVAYVEAYADLDLLDVVAVDDKFTRATVKDGAPEPDGSEALDALYQALSGDATVRARYFTVEDVDYVIVDWAAIAPFGGV